MNNRPDLMEWLVAKFGKKDIELHGDILISDLCKLGHLESLQWLLKTCGPSSSFLFALGLLFGGQRDLNNALYCAYRNGHLEVAEWIVTSFRSYNAEFRNIALNKQWLCSSEKRTLESITWLTTTFKLTPADIDLNLIGPMIRNLYLTDEFQSIDFVTKEFQVPETDRVRILTEAVVSDISLACYFEQNDPQKSLHSLNRIERGIALYGLTPEGVMDTIYAPEKQDYIKSKLPGLFAR